MKIVFAGGGSGGHFYPIIAVSEALQDIVKERKLLEPRMYFISTTPFDERELFEHGIEFRKITAGKVRRYFSILNFVDLFKTALGIVEAVRLMYAIYPDVVFSKGGYASFPTVFAARLLRIPVVIHESDASPGRVNQWTGKFARKIAVSYPEAAEFFPKEKVALLGNPVRKNIKTPAYEGSREFLNLEANAPVILILGGSLGADRINGTILEALPRLVERYEIIHQTGEKLYKEVTGTANIILEGNPKQSRYKSFNYLNTVSLRMAAGAATLAISRAGSGSIFELAAWGLPAILIPIPEEISHDQRKNAFAYAREGGAVILEQNNLTPNVLASEIDRLVDHPELREKMKEGAKRFARLDASEKIAEALLAIVLEHEDS
jgi:UDP-N-acetylglucosamine--N-acetylmuramyl-(pentapeptide) pyrophosphoryl-undecaprenol N-acetylglucosamine transferase